tara:strand:+ start:187 stop:1110 length:924 start_codon:yes stop_codon:yes gene_type:complete
MANENQPQQFQYGSAMMKNPDTYTKISNAAKLMKTLRQELDHTVEIGLDGVEPVAGWRERNLLFRWPLDGIQGTVTDAKWRQMVRAAVLGGLEDVARAQHNGRWRIARYTVEIEDRPADHLVIPASGNIEHARYQRGSREEIMVRAVAADVSGADDLEYVDGAPAKQGQKSQGSGGAEDIAAALRDAIVSISNPEAAASAPAPDAAASAIEALAAEHGLAPNQISTLLDSLKAKNRNDAAAEAAAEVEAPAPAPDPNKYGCGLCSRKFKTPQSIRFHMKKHTSAGELTTEDAAELAETWIQAVKNGA